MTVMLVLVTLRRRFPPSFSKLCFVELSQVAPPLVIYVISLYATPPMIILIVPLHPKIKFKISQPFGIAPHLFGHRAMWLKLIHITTSRTFKNNIDLELIHSHVNMCEPMYMISPAVGISRNACISSRIFYLHPPSSPIFYA